MRLGVGTIGVMDVVQQGESMDQHQILIAPRQKRQKLMEPMMETEAGLNNRKLCMN
jgi:BMFP domain-containing protein YqiC